MKKLLLFIILISVLVVAGCGMQPGESVFGKSNFAGQAIGSSCESDAECDRGEECVRGVCSGTVYEEVEEVVEERDEGVARDRGRSERGMSEEEMVEESIGYGGEEPIGDGTGKCGEGLTPCGPKKDCVHMGTDPSNCGSCGNWCFSQDKYPGVKNSECINSVCVLKECKVGLMLKDGKCVKVASELKGCFEGDSNAPFFIKSMGNSATITTEDDIINPTDYFVLSGGSTKYYLLQYVSSDKQTKSNPKIKFKNVGSGEILEYSVLSVSAPTIATIKLGGYPFIVQSASSAGSNDFQIHIDLDGDGSIGTNAVADSCVIDIPDANLKKEILKQLGKSSGEVTVGEAKKVVYLDAPTKGISNLKGLEYFTSLKMLNLKFNQISDVNALKGLTKLTMLFLDFNQISDISALKGLTQLTLLVLNNNQISDINSLKGLTQLTTLYISSNKISDISALKGLTQLTNLYISSNKISDISALKGLTQLAALEIVSSQISDISALKGLTQLKWLSLSNNQISDVNALKGLTKLTMLFLDFNQISDISALKSLTQLTLLVLNNNQISDISALKGLTQLSHLFLSSNQNLKYTSIKNGVCNKQNADLDDKATIQQFLAKCV